MNEQIEELYKNLEAKDKIINEQVLIISELNDRIDKAIEVLKEIDGCDAYIKEVLEILGDKECPKAIANEDMGIKLDEFKNIYNDVWEYGDKE